MPLKMKSPAAFEIAGELTKIALEQKLIAHSSDPVISAKNVVDYLNIIYDSLLTDD